MESGAAGSRHAGRLCASSVKFGEADGRDEKMYLEVSYGSDRASHPDVRLGALLDFSRRPQMTRIVSVSPPQPTTRRGVGTQSLEVIHVGEALPRVRYLTG